MKRLIISAFMIVFTNASISQVSEMYKAEIFNSKGIQLPYRILYPKNFNSTQKYPLVLFLHGSGERGSDNVKQLTHGAKLFASDSVMDKYPAIVVFPQCPAESYWANVKIVNQSDGNRSFDFPAKGKPTPAMAA
ncbi:MAG TPA: phospholipase, partial [Tenuifilum sp.]|nr:phospholipase [Tenuifilum sp.]